jgi:CRP/FNR family cyclic AMP-dependent transcriptional regulator
VINAPELHDFFDRNPDALMAMSQMLIWRQRQRIHQLAGLGSVDAKARLARVLLALAARFGRENADGILLDADLSQVELAQLASASEASVHRSLRDFRNAEVMATGYRRLVITNPDALRKTANP